MKNLFLTAALALTLSAGATTLNTINNTNISVQEQEKEYKKVDQGAITQEVLKSAVAKYQGYELVNAYMAADGSDYKFELTKDGKEVTAYFKSNGEFIKEETA